MTRHRWGAALAVLLAALVPAVAGAATPAGQPDSFAPVADGPVYAVAHAPGGNTYIGGDFSHVGPRSGPGVPLAPASMNGTGTALVQGTLGSAGFPEVAGGEVKAVVSDDAGGWFIGGTFTHVGGVDLPRLAHIKGDGTVDSGWRPAPTVTSGTPSVNALAVGDASTPHGATANVSGGALYVGGNFTAIGAATLSNLAAYSLSLSGISAGTPGSAPVGGWNPNPNGAVHALAVRTISFNVGSPAVLTSMHLVVAGGEFAAAGNQATQPTVNRLAAIRGIGAVDSTGASTAGNGVNLGAGVTTSGQKVSTVALGPTSAEYEDPATGTNRSAMRAFAVYAGGDWTTPAAPRAKLQALRVDFAIRPTAGTGKASTPPGTVTGTGYTNWKPNANLSVGSLALSSDGQTLYVGGQFSQLGNTSGTPSPVVTRNSLAAVRAIPTTIVGSSASADLPGSCTDAATACGATISPWNPAPNGAVRSLAISGDNVVAAGNFTSIGTNTATRNGLAGLGAVGAGANEGKALDWDPMPAGGQANALATDADSIYAGGAFSAIGAVERKNLAAIDQQGNVTGFDAGTSCTGPGCFDEVRALALKGDGSRLFVGGGFTQLDGAPRVHLGAVDTATGNVVPGWAPDPDSLNKTTGNPDGLGWVFALDVVGENVYTGGAFHRIGGVERRRLAALDANSGAVLGWDPSAGCPLGTDSCHVYTIEASCGGTVYAGGAFETIGGQARPRLAELQPVGAANAGAVTSWNPQPSSVVHDLVSHGSTVYAGGKFAVAGNAVRQHLVALDAGTAKAVDKWNPSADQDVYAVGLSGDGTTVYAGGIYTKVGGADRAGLAALDAVGVGDGSGDAIAAWNPAPAVPLTHIDSKIAYQGTYALAVWGDNVFAGGEFGQLGSRAQYGYGSFTSGPDPSAVADACAAQPQVEQPPAVEAPLAIPVLSKLRVTKRLKALFNLSMAADVELDLQRKLLGYELPVAKRAARPGAGRRPTVCREPNRLSEHRAKRYVKRTFRKRLRRMSSSERRKRFVKERIARLRCPYLKTVKELSVQGRQGANRVALAGRKGLPAGRYRLVALALSEAGVHGAPVTVSFRVGEDGLKVVPKPTNPGTG